MIGARSLPVKMHTIEPALHGDYYGGFFYAVGRHRRHHKFTRGLVAACEARESDCVQCEHRQHCDDRDGLDIRWKQWTAASDGNEIADSVAVDGVVICAGVGSRALAASLGDRVNVYPVKAIPSPYNWIATIAAPPAPCVSLLDDEAKIVSSRLGPDRFRVAGTAEFNGFNRDIRGRPYRATH